MKKTLKNSLKFGLAAASLALISACGGGGDTIVVVDQPHGFLSVDNLNVGNGTVCIEDIFLDANSAQGQQVARDLVDYYGTFNFSLIPIHNAYSAPTYCGGPTANFVPAPGLIIDANAYYNIIVPTVR